MSNSHTRPLEWRESGNNPLSVTLVLGIVQQLLESEPLNTQHTWITVLASSPSVRLARLGEADSSVTLRVQGTHTEHLVSSTMPTLTIFGALKSALEGFDR